MNDFNACLKRQMEKSGGRVRRRNKSQHVYGYYNNFSPGISCVASAALFFVFYLFICFWYFRKYEIFAVWRQMMVSGDYSFGL
jgi:hypothetical protein